jgi:hypothetical protein
MAWAAKVVVHHGSRVETCTKLTLRVILKRSRKFVEEDAASFIPLSLLL